MGKNTALVFVAGLLTLACRRPAAEVPPDDAMIWGGQEHAPTLPRSPDPPTIPNGCTRHPESTDPERRLSVEFGSLLYGSPRDRPTLTVGQPLAVTLTSRQAISTPIQIEICLQRPDETVRRVSEPFANAELRCPGCDPYPGAPPDVCAPERICTIEYQEPKYSLFDASATELAGAYLLSIEAPHGEFDPYSVILELAPPG